VLPEYFRVREVDSGWLAVMPRPRAGDWLADELKGLSHAGINVVVSLLESSEAYDLELSEEAVACEHAGIRYRSFPIPDRCVPSRLRELLELLRCIRIDLREGHGVAVHCRAGIGRSGLVAACILVSAGVTPDDALSEISSARGIPVPDTEEQIDWLYDNAMEISNEFADF